MTLFSKTTLGAALLTFAVIGGSATYLASTLKAPEPQYVAFGVGIDVPPSQQTQHAEVTTEGQAS